ncbi:beta-galactosidase [Mycolicibacterium phlei]|uniref:beta-galactosidase n=1 Tax=Mycolicibacterium phlei TaxID=1771 RepID=UPI00025AEE10|nr:beta-galactosidase [Mycolicibacterium phlei]EID14884.1 hypothetical protein MPHLEI_09494 [Mycolicibacterium phlei RIVM601174]MBF4191704.1 hypothetical protein [Mycolicibacterium phlei]
MALAVGLVCTTAIVDLGRPRRPGGVLAAVTVSIDPAPTTVGIADSDVYGMTQADVDRTFDLMRADNIRAVRLMVPWAGVEPTRGNLNWSVIDKTINSAAARNLAVVAMINSTPLWAVAPGGQYLSGRPASPEAYGEFVARVISRYPGKIAAVEIWNEPNAIFFYTPKPDPAGYVDLLKAAYPRIKAIDPSIEVLAGSVGSVVDVAGLAINPVAFVSGMYAAGAQPYFDALAFHPYHYSLKFSAGVGVANSPVLQLMQMRQLMVANGDADKRIWSTEFGQPVSSGGAARQNDYIADVLRKWQELPYTGPMFIYTTRDRRTGSLGAEDTIGIYNSNWTPKPAQATVRAATTGALGKADEFVRFAAFTDPDSGGVLSPVFRTTDGRWAQVRTVNTVYETPDGFVTSPNPVALKAGLHAVSPKGPFTGGYQDFNTSNGLRVWYSEATGAHSGSRPFAAAWVPELGLALTDESGSLLGTSMQFQNGKITWTPLGGMSVTWNPGHGPGATPTTTPTTVPTTTTTAPTSLPTSTPPVTPTPIPAADNPISAVLTLLGGLLGALSGQR